MRLTTGAIIILLYISCTHKKQSLPVTGTWKLLSGTIIEKNDTTITDYTQNKQFIKIINDSHFAFLGHDLSKGKDSSSAFFAAGGGRYTLKDSTYTEHLEYCNDRNWEANEFHFTVHINNDTLIQQGVEKVEATGIDRLNIEKYVRVKE
ncbi:lipocalin-like domain-containing protein [Niastella caeni]|uniref:Lipocalin-like domain-containing protein n=1 Tax=Niastella caeni TaxID=2569763 RepID=A0A4S8HZF1_9BACT|nr:lipocalin-like domain-containing protein [Niastella caeni]THU41193.1 lipocalin-like domain-containing protein [Niastella caeni]